MRSLVEILPYDDCVEVPEGFTPLTSTNAILSSLVFPPMTDAFSA
jgi:hypothetical protein